MKVARTYSQSGKYLVIRQYLGPNRFDCRSPLSQKESERDISLKEVLSINIGKLDDSRGDLLHFSLELLITILIIPMS